MIIRRITKYTFLFALVAGILLIAGVPARALAAQDKAFTVVLDAGHGGKDHGAIDNGTREKDINLAVALRLGELIKKKLKNTKVVYTRDDDTFVSLQGRADIANKAKGDLFISIHTNSVDAKNKNRRTVAGASVYTQGPHKDDANLQVAKRENSVIELENGYEQKYSGFDPNKVESYIIFEMAQKNNLSKSHRFAKNVQKNLVSQAGRKDRGVHQAGFWVLWSTSMPSVLIELDFICNPESAKFMSSKAGVDKLAGAIFEAVKTYEQNYRQKQRMLASQTSAEKERSLSVASTPGEEIADEALFDTYIAEERNTSADREMEMVAVSRAAASDSKDLSHANLNATRSQQRARHATDGRRRRSAAARNASEARDVEVNHIEVREEFTGEMAALQPEVETPAGSEVAVDKASASDGKDKKKSKKKEKKEKKEKKSKGGDRKSVLAKADSKNAGNSDKTQSDRPDPKLQKGSREWVAEVNKIAAREKKEEKRLAKEVSEASQHAGSRKSLKSRN